jgi:hypothetical protein
MVSHRSTGRPGLLERSYETASQPRGRLIDRFVVECCGFSCLVCPVLGMCVLRTSPW